MAVSANHNLGGCVILLRLYLIDIVRKIIGGFQGHSPFHSHRRRIFTSTCARLVETSLPPWGPYRNISLSHTKELKLRNGIDKNCCVAVCGKPYVKDKCEPKHVKIVDDLRKAKLEERAAAAAATAAKAKAEAETVAKAEAEAAAQA